MTNPRIPSDTAGGRECDRFPARVVVAARLHAPPRHAPDRVVKLRDGEHEDHRDHCELEREPGGAVPVERLRAEQVAERHPVGAPDRERAAGERCPPEAREPPVAAEVREEALALRT